MNKLDLSIINNEKYKVLSGVDLGEEARCHFKLDELDEKEEVVNFIIPDDVLSVNSSFFSGMFQTSVKKLGELRFREKYLFECDDIIQKNIENGIYNIVKTLDLLGGKK